jgi:hypothetical protein
MIVNIFPSADPPYGLVEGIHSERALSILTRAITSWYAFGRYDHVIVDLAGFDGWSARVIDELATAVTTAAGGGRWLAFFPVGADQMCGADLERTHSYPDRGHAQIAVRTNPLPAAPKRRVALMTFRVRATAAVSRRTLMRRAWSALCTGERWSAPSLPGA